MYQPSTLCLTTQHEANTLNSYPHQIEKKKHTQVKLMAFESTAAAASQNPASAPSKSFVNEEIHRGATAACIKSPGSRTIITDPVQPTRQISIEGKILEN